MSLTSREKPLDYSIMKYRAKKNKMLRTSTTTESGDEIAGGSERVSPPSQLSQALLALPFSRLPLAEKVYG